MKHGRWKVCKNKGMYFGHLNVNSLLSKVEELRTLAFNTNISALLGITETRLDNIFSNEELKIDVYNFTVRQKWWWGSLLHQK